MVLQLFLKHRLLFNSTRTSTISSTIQILFQVMTIDSPSILLVFLMLFQHDNQRFKFVLDSQILHFFNDISIWQYYNHKKMENNNNALAQRNKVNCSEIFDDCDGLE